MDQLKRLILCRLDPFVRLTALCVNPLVHHSSGHPAVSALSAPPRAPFSILRIVVIISAFSALFLGISPTALLSMDSLVASSPDSAAFDL